MTRLKKSICDEAYELVTLLDSVIDDEDFVDNIIRCISYNDIETIMDLRDEL